jgi:hypothetical protein
MSIVQELKRRNVFRVAVAYIVAAWVIIEVSSLILDVYESPDSVIRIIVALLALGLPFALVFAWAFEVTPEGIKRESEVDRSLSATHFTAKRLDLLTIAMVVVAVGLFSIDRFWPETLGNSTVSSAATNETERGVVWATQQLLELNRLRDLGDARAAFAIAKELAPILTDESTAKDLWEGISWSGDIESEPAGARVLRQSILNPDSGWEELGMTPLQDVRFALNDGYRLVFKLAGYRDVEILDARLWPTKWTQAPVSGPIKLDPVDVLPEKMVRIPGFTHDLVEYADYFMDRYEVTNREYQRFVATGGYESREFWTHTFAGDGKEIPWEEAVMQFVDRTGRPGPSTWSGGVYPDGLGDHPVSGVSWYEALAYAKFIGKEMPTWSHHKWARRFYSESSWLIASRSNFGGIGTRPVGENRAMTTMGVYDLAGNVREWAWNGTGQDEKVTAGGAWSDAYYHAEDLIPKSPWDRDSTHGLRLIRTFDADDKLARLQQPVRPLERRDYSKEQPIPDSEFAIYRRMYAYDSLPLDAEVIEVETFDHWIRERVAFDLPYGERGGAFLYIPKNAEPPYETVIYWPGDPVLEQHSVDEEFVPAFDFIVRSGRALAQPIFKGAFDRDDSNFSINQDSLWPTRESTTSTSFRDFQIKWMQELSRTIDYLETRDDMETDRLGYYGFSWGGAAAPIVLALEDRRIDAAVLHVGGLDDYYFLPEVDPFNFLSHVRVPVLMINGEFDVGFPLALSQKPMFDRLATEPDHKKLYVTPTAHFVPRDVLIRETLDWFDRYLGAEIDVGRTNMD